MAPHRHNTKNPTESAHSLALLPLGKILLFREKPQTLGISQLPTSHQMLLLQGKMLQTVTRKTLPNRQQMAVQSAMMGHRTN